AATSAGREALEHLALDGVGSLDPDEALDLLDALLAADAARELGHASVAVMPETDPSAAATSELVARLREQSPASRRIAGLSELILTEVAAVLRQDIERVDPTRPLRELGLDSMMAVELVARLRQALAIEATSTLIWQHPTVERLTAHLAQRLELDVEPAATTSSGPVADAAELVLELSDDELALARAFLIGSLEAVVHGPPQALSTRVREEQDLARRKRIWTVAIRWFLLGGGALFILAMTMMIWRNQKRLEAQTSAALGLVAGAPGESVIDQLDEDTFADQSLAIMQARRQVLTRGVLTVALMTAALLLTLAMLESLVWEY
ncbi:MAG: hypothetical protein KC457_19835, partial [Myxococcales bacterium]|nr:hypothetical protein [Myxococcales bacterium]